jgi:acyl carrier protein
VLVALEYRNAHGGPVTDIREPEHDQGSTQRTVPTTRLEAIAWIADVFHVDTQSLTPATAREDLVEWDSLGVLALMAALDSDFGILLTDEGLAKLTSVNDILEILQRAGKLDT